MPTSQLDVTGLEAIQTRIGAAVGALGDKIRAEIAKIQELTAGATGNQAKVDAVVASLTAVADQADAIQALTEDVVNPDTPPVDPNAPIPDVPPTDPNAPASRGRR